jgi:hypothetical protein
VTGYAEFCRHDDGLTRHIFGHVIIFEGGARTPCFVSFYLDVAEILPGNSFPLIVRKIIDIQAVPVVFSISKKSFFSPLANFPCFHQQTLKGGKGENKQGKTKPALP